MAKAGTEALRGGVVPWIRECHELCFCGGPRGGDNICNSDDALLMQDLTQDLEPCTLWVGSASAGGPRARGSNVPSPLQ